MIEYKTGDPPEVHTCFVCHEIHDLEHDCTRTNSIPEAWIDNLIYLKDMFGENISTISQDQLNQINSVANQLSSSIEQELKQR